MLWRNKNKASIHQQLITLRNIFMGLRFAKTQALATTYNYCTYKCFWDTKQTEGPSFLWFNTYLVLIQIDVTSPKIHFHLALLNVD